MLWLRVVVGLVLSIVALMGSILRPRPLNLHKLGSVSNDWIARQRVKRAPWWQ
jgi:hypothetical protein